MPPITPPSPTTQGFLAVRDSSYGWDDVRSQYIHPQDVFTLLMLVGGDIIQTALVRLVSSSGPVIPIAFSFGWVAYSLSAVLAAIGSHRLAPRPDCACMIVEVGSGYARTVESWVLARLVRDFERKKTKENSDISECDKGLTISFLESTGNGGAKKTGNPSPDWWFNVGIGLVPLVLQLGISIVPGLLHHDWVILAITGSGLVLAQLQGRIPQWKEELWNGRDIPKDEQKIVCLTRGNGNKDAIVIRSLSGDRNLADVAGAREVNSRRTVVWTSGLALLWLLLCFTAQGVNENTGYLILVGAVGMVQNVVLAGLRYRPGHAGFHLKEWQITTTKVERGERKPNEQEKKPKHQATEVVVGNMVHSDKVMMALKLADEFEMGVGIALVPVFFQGI
ncbi:hypothetical protein AAF712_009392 [Marasmius tenuissimus]|uniref:Uncharacterized protein n=1 Tax=Marasmius tenuissimus TaxID=585030 RepID=A0ABR2ZQV5_9AGAR